MTRSECEAAVARPGRFEGAPRYIPFFHDAWLDGCGHVADDATDVVEIDPTDVAIFPELKGFTEVVLEWDDFGFIDGYAR